MSASICWEPVSKGASLYVLAPERFLQSLEAAGMRPRQAGGYLLGPEHMPTLRSLAVLYSGDTPDKNPYAQLVEALEKHGEVRIWAEY